MPDQFSEAGAYEREKDGKYLELAGMEKSFYHGAILETYGAFGTGLDTLISKLAAQASRSGVPEHTNFESRLRSAISITLQRGNALVYARGCSQCFARAAPRGARARRARSLDLGPSQLTSVAFQTQKLTDDFLLMPFG